VDDKWRTLTCPICRGYGLVSEPMAWYGFNECDNCEESGTVWLRPKGHSFQYPGGPATGYWGPEYYERGKPVMPYDWHAWSASDAEIEKFVTDRSGSFDQDLNRVLCECGFEGSIREHQVHANEAEKQFILEHQNAV
jgi:hypothetical protein